MRSVFTALRRTKSYLVGLGDDVSQRQVEVFKELTSFVKSGIYTDYSKKDIFLSFEGASDDIIAIKLDVTENAVRKIRSRISNDAYNAIGSDVFELIESGIEENLNDVSLRLKVAYNNFSTSTLFPAELIGLIRQSSLDEKSFEFEDCLPELNLLRWLSIPKMVDVMSNVDTDRLNYILRVLDNQDGTLADRMKIATYICSSTKELASKYGSRAIKFPPKRDEVLSVDIDNSSEGFTETGISEEELEDNSFLVES